MPIRITYPWIYKHTIVKGEEAVGGFFGRGDFWFFLKTVSLGVGGGGWVDGIFSTFE